MEDITVREKLSALRSIMKRKGIDVYLVFCTDYHIGEFINPHFEELRYISGFTGYVGTLIVTSYQAYMYTDNRYTTQAKLELIGSGIEVCIEKTESDMEERIREVLPQNGVLAFDGKYVSVTQGVVFQKIVDEKCSVIKWEENLITSIWKNRPVLPSEPIYQLPIQYTGESVSSKIERLRYELNKQSIDLHIMAETDAICWLLNIRGGDIPYMCQPLCYAVIDKNQVVLYIEQTRIEQSILDELETNGIILCKYEEIYEYEIAQSVESILMDSARVNYAIYQQLHINEHNKVTFDLSPVMLMKEIKNKIEVANIKNAALKDSVALTKFICWVKKNVGYLSMSEYELAEKTEQFRRKQPLFVCPSFETGCAYGDNAAMVFYVAKKDKSQKVEAKGMLLVDSGGNYLDGTTDITRTLVLGPITDQMKLHYTAVLSSAFTLSEARFPYGVKGCHLDVLARSNMWNLGLDYSTRSGHGVGYLLNVHEGPVDFKWKRSSEDAPILEENMILTIEPGIYLEGEYGIRLENDVVVCKSEIPEDGSFLKFEKITFVPFDREAIVPECLTVKQLEDLNQYHQQVWEKISPYLDEEECVWLKENTRRI